MPNYKGALGGAASGAAAGSVLGPWGAAAGGVIGGALGLFGGGDDGGSDEQRKQQIAQGDAAAGFADTSQQGYQQLGQQGAGALAALRRQAEGANSVSAEQLRQGLGQLASQQYSAAAGASPRNAASAARTAAIQAARIGTGMAGQQAVAGLQERQQAQQAYGQLLGQLRGQDLQGTLGSRQTALGAYSGYKPAPSFIEQYGPAIAGGLSAYANTKLSDRRLKENIADGDGDANKAVEGLRAYTYAYKNQKHGKGQQLGIMAQDLERAGLGHTVIETREGKAVHGASLSTANTAMIAALGRRVAQLEGGSKKGGR